MRLSFWRKPLKRNRSAYIRDIRDIRILSSIFILYFFRETRPTIHVHRGILLSINFYLRFLPTIKVSTFTYEVTFKTFAFHALAFELSRFEAIPFSSERF